MPRRRRTSPAEDLTNALALLPWWACLAAGLVAYLGLHAFALSQPPPVTASPHSALGLQGAVFGSIFRGLAAAGEYIVPILCIAAAAMSFLGRRQRRELFLHATAGGDSAATIDAMSWQDFELLIAEAFRHQGFTVAEKGGAGPDGGVDMELSKENERWLVQAKHWRAKQVPVEVVRELAGVMPFRRAVGGYVVTSGTFTLPAQEFAEGRGIKLVNGKRLESMLKQGRASLDAKAKGRTLKPAPVEQVALKQVAAPLCPVCSRSMILRTARKGVTAGADFWGCSAYPKCRGTRPA